MTPLAPPATIGGVIDANGSHELRAADADREAAAERLGTALAEGRLDLDEYEQRLRRAYATRTYGELDRILADLPAAPPELPDTSSETPLRPLVVSVRRRGCCW